MRCFVHGTALFGRAVNRNDKPEAIVFKNIFTRVNTMMDQ
ncbi:hypothetical protein CLOSYM_02438 [[Clostridium] symbiosum ATCC 14940]|uniref:Uncharacterized protein n=1 Tax=[Clostridium] symbiosum ATCC 14940 TaxID=411472 RepID=A0ABC9TXD5_CLOSY|nr:hypothetical protein CLOSYM_02438 [[Clostridium] symbiosum ATCC 14940]